LGQEAFLQELPFKGRPCEMLRLERKREKMGKWRGSGFLLDSAIRTAVLFWDCGLKLWQF
jgi:hypothetical protein